LTLLQRVVTVLCLFSLFLYGYSSVPHPSVPYPYLVLPHPPQVSSFSEVSPSMPDMASWHHSPPSTLWFKVFSTFSEGDLCRNLLSGGPRGDGWAMGGRWRLCSPRSIRCDEHGFIGDLGREGGGWVRCLHRYARLMRSIRLHFFSRSTSKSDRFPVVVVFGGVCGRTINRLLGVRLELFLRSCR